MKLFPTSLRRWFLPSLAIFAIIIALPVWDGAAALAAVKLRPALAGKECELELYLLVKGSDVLLLAIIFTLSSNWRRLGFAGGLGLRDPDAARHWAALWPVWAAAAVNLFGGGIHVADPYHFLGWALLAFFVAFGEESVFRAIIPAIILRAQTKAANPEAGAPDARIAFIVAAVLFGLSHIVGIAAGIDIRLVLGQVVLAAGVAMCLGWVRVKTNSIWPGMIAHGTMDVLGFLVADGVTAGMKYSLTGFLVLLGVALIAVGWGAWLFRRPLHFPRW